MNRTEPITKAEICGSLQEAEDKLRRIIEREGDEDGIRNEEWYFLEILKEVILTKRQSTDINKKGTEPLPDAIAVF